jgi:hypothetical protein
VLVGEPVGVDCAGGVDGRGDLGCSGAEGMAEEG